MLFVYLALATAHAPRCNSGVTNDLLACAAEAHDKADARLNARWKTMRHSPQQVVAQRAWLAWRDAECEAENYAIGGRIEDFVRLMCLADMTEQRAIQLEKGFQP